MKVAVTVSFKIIPQYWDEFLELMKKNAKTSLLIEWHCLQFDVCTDEKYPNEVFLYEIYDSEEAFEFHLRTEHFLSFDLAVSRMVESKEVKIYSMVN